MLQTLHWQGASCCSEAAAWEGRLLLLLHLCIVTSCEDTECELACCTWTLGDAEEDRPVTIVHALHVQQMWTLLELPIRTPRASLWLVCGATMAVEPPSLPLRAMASNALLCLSTAPNAGRHRSCHCCNSSCKPNYGCRAMQGQAATACSAASQKWLLHRSVSQALLQNMWGLTQRTMWPPAPSLTVLSCPATSGMRC